MSDVFPGVGWWLASDGLWYEASTHPDPSYRAAFGADAVHVETPELAVSTQSSDETSSASPDDAVLIGREFPSVEITPPHEDRVADGASTGQLGSVIRSAAQLREPEVASVVAEADAETLVAPEEAEAEDTEIPLPEEATVTAGATALHEEAAVEEIAPPAVPSDASPKPLVFEAPVVAPADVDVPIPESEAAAIDEAPTEQEEGTDSGVEVNDRLEQRRGHLTFSSAGAVDEEDESTLDRALVEELSVKESPEQAVSSDEETASPEVAEAAGGASIPDVGSVPTADDDSEPVKVAAERTGDDIGETAEPVTGGWHKIESEAGPTPEPPGPVSPPVTEAPDAPASVPSKPPRSQSEAFEQARRARLAEAQKSAEQLRDSVRRSRERDAKMAGYAKDYGAVESSGTATLRMRTPGAPASNGANPAPQKTLPDLPAPSVPEAEESAPQLAPPTVAGRTKLEIQAEATKSTPTIGLVNAEPSQTTALVHVPEVPLQRTDRLDRVLSVLLFLSGLAMIAGTFMVWTTGSVDEVGWDRSDGVIVVVAGVVAATAAGPLFAGIRSIARGIAIVAGVVAVMVVGVVAITTLSNTEQTGLSIGNGLIVVLVAAIASIITSSSIRNEPGY